MKFDMTEFDSLLTGPEAIGAMAHAPWRMPRETAVESTPSEVPAVNRLYAKIFANASITSPASELDRARTSSSAPVKMPRVAPPRNPTTLADTGLRLPLLSELAMKFVYLQGTATGRSIAQSMRLPFSIVDVALRALIDQKCVEVTSGDPVGRVSYRFTLTELGRTRSREIFNDCRYVGPAPVPIQDYIQQCRQQPVTGIPCTRNALQEAFTGFVIQPCLLSELGPAVCSGKSLFLYGPPGNGKTTTAKRLGHFLNRFGGEIYVPYAIQIENSIVTIFDPGIHQTTDDAVLAQRGISSAAESSPSPAPSEVVHGEPFDIRWRRIKRPVVVTGGELTLDMLDLQYNKVSNFYSAPVHIKANGGVFLIDDFGRQLVSPKELLNRWTVPLEERIDYLKLATGTKLMLPFEQLTIFSTNLDPRDLVDDAFLRRIKHKVLIDTPNRALYTTIFQLVCQQRQLPYEQSLVDLLYSHYYDKGRRPRSSDPRDLIEIAISICSYHEQPLALSSDLMLESAGRFFAIL
jgi:hypothetical protein